MLDSFIKYFTLTWCCIYTFTKLLKLQLSKIQKISIILPIALSSFIACIFLSYYPPFNLLTIFIFVIIINSKTSNKSIHITVVVSTIAFGISYILYTISCFLCLPFLYTLFLSINSQSLLNTISSFLISLIQIICNYLFFKIKRLKNGIISLEKRINNDLCVFVSILILFFISLFYKSDEVQYLDSLIIFIIVVIGLFLVLYVNRHITNTYLSKINKREIDKLNIELTEQVRIVAELKLHNENLSKIIHRDNKLIPAMKIAIEEILICQSPDEQKKKAEALLPQLKTMSAERVGIVTKYESTNKKLPSTGIFSVDSSLKYLLKKANDKSITFDLSVTAEISNIANNIISEDDLNTLILDLGENAVIATSDMEHQNVLVVMGYENNRFCISFYDSGNLFDPKVISKLGIKRITTHKNTGGSGIGMMTTFELLQKYQASFILDETINSDKFTKKVSIHFDSKNAYHIQTNRAEIINISKKRTDLIIN